MPKNLKPLKITERVLAPLRSKYERSRIQISDNEFREIKGPNEQGTFIFVGRTRLFFDIKDLPDLLNAVYEFGVAHGKNELRRQLKDIMQEKYYV